MELKIKGVSFANKDLRGSNFIRCNFIDCDFSLSNLEGVNFEGAIFNNCQFNKANLWGVNFWGADIKGLYGLETTLLKHTNFFRNKMDKSQKEFINRNPNSISLGDYGSFVKYFNKQVGLDDDGILDKFAWLNLPYFLRMFGKQ